MPNTFYPVLYQLTASLQPSFMSSPQKRSRWAQGAGVGGAETELLCGRRAGGVTAKNCVPRTLCVPANREMALHQGCIYIPHTILIFWREKPAKPASPSLGWTPSSRQETGLSWAGAKQQQDRWEKPFHMVCVFSATRWDPQPPHQSYIRQKKVQNTPR